MHRLLYRLRVGLSDCQVIILLLTIKDLAELYSFSKDIRTLLRLLSALKKKARGKALSDLIVAPLAASAENLSQFDTMVLKAVDFSGAELHRYEIKKTLSPEIEKEFQRVEELCEKMENLRRKINAAGKIESDRILGRHLSATKSVFTKMYLKNTKKSIRSFKNYLKRISPNSALKKMSEF